jgi:hypothetical protein
LNTSSTKFNIIFPSTTTFRNHELYAFGSIDAGSAGRKHLERSRLFDNCSGEFSEESRGWN